MTERNGAPKADSRNYDRVAGVYETLANVYSGNLIRRSKMVQLESMRPGDRVLFLGVGSGEEAVAAARRGLDVTAIDLSEAMIARLDRRMRRAGLSARTIAGDALAHDPGEGYDVVCGNYFYNVFGPADMERVFAHTIGYVRPGGLLMVADMAPPKGPLAPFAWAYLRFGLSFFWLLGLASQHPVYDYASLGRRNGLDVEAIDDLPATPFFPALYRSVAFRRPAKLLEGA